MQQISELTSTATSEGEFTNGSVSTGVSPTILDAGWFNTIQRELIAVVKAAGLTLSPSNDAQVLAAIKALSLSRSSPGADIAADGTASTFLSNLGLSGGLGTGIVGRVVKITRFASSGTLTKNALTKAMFVFGVGGGGAGGGTGDSGSSSVRGGGGGGGGTYGELLITSPASSYSVTIGAGGTSLAGADGTAGGSTLFGSVLTLPGGNGGTLGIQLTTSGRGAGGGVKSSAATGADLSIQGQGGGDSFAVNGTTIVVGAGGDSKMGFGGNQVVATSTTGTAFSTAGSTGTGKGSGGAGGNCGIGGAAVAGGAGQPGYLVVVELM